MKFWIIPVVLFLGSSVLFSSLNAQEEETQTKLDFSGSFRTRGFALGRDLPLERTTPTTPIYDLEAEKNEANDVVNQTIENEIERFQTGQRSGLSKRKENLNFYDTRFLFNMNFATSKYVEGLWGMQVGDINFGGRGLPVSDPSGYDPNIVGAQAGGERGNSAVNVQTNFLFMNFKLPESGFQTRVGLQLFRSAGGRVLFATGTGVNILKTFQFLRLTFDGGVLRARERSLLDSDNNGFADKNFQNSNIVFGKLKMNYFRNYNAELYSYVLKDNDRTTNETAELYWHGFNNEFNYSRFSVILHGVLNTGTVRQFRPILDENGNPFYAKEFRHFVKGGLYDVQFTYRLDDTTNISLIALGTTGRPGFELDGISSNLRGNGYRPLAPGYAISNIAVDFTGGYALFNARTMTGLNEYGANYNFVAFGPYQITLGYFLLYSSLSPKIENNRVFNEAAGYRTSTYFGQEYNLNLRWNIYGDLQLIFRSGYFIAGDGLYTYLDSRNGKIIREAFFTLEHRF
ncbi:hypothetical protein [Leptospira sp. GIMC2001]|uniref:hypothetical protein n=1 Tax=Leptospira sp. GIMC2001 TaxID=1513297 RepID=UPI00234BD2F3|nr:hypothetical protein [Leptospira sp. GIMC2001]WCL49506.1 hypothetical protein O4O04_19810 [Leptospira sp. GIMC2001]